MDGVHDLGGQQNHGPIAVRDDDAPFHDDWEWRMWAIARAIARPPDWNVDKFRFTRELLQPVEYLARSYFDQWYTAYAAMLLGSGLATVEELSTGASAERAPASLTPMSVADVSKLRNVSMRFDRAYVDAPRFGVGQRVRARLSGSLGHTRLPRYVRGHAGIVRSLNGAHVVPDESAEGREAAEPLYTVSFMLADLFLERSGSADKVSLDLWERYLEPA
jgi:nitrile hydratase beta subunit